MTKIRKLWSRLRGTPDDCAPSSKALINYQMKGEVLNILGEVLRKSFTKHLTGKNQGENEDVRGLFLVSGSRVFT